jgi:hypothetical protein
LELSHTGEYFQAERRRSLEPRRAIESAVAAAFTLAPASSRDCRVIGKWRIVKIPDREDDFSRTGIHPDLW